MNGSNLPTKENFLGLRGIAARTGKSNFDISEWMLIRLVRALRGREATIAMLCKTAIARKLLRYAWQNDGQIAKASLYRIDAAEHFGASVDACLLLARTGSAGPETADVFDSLSAAKPSVRMGLAGQDLVADIVAYRRMRHLEGLCPFQWRSGVKHDCASVMELRSAKAGHFENKLGEVVELEPQNLFPLLKCTDLANGRTTPKALRGRDPTPRWRRHRRSCPTPPRAPGAISNLIAKNSRREKAAFTKAVCHLPCLASVITPSRRGKWRCPGCIAIRAFSRRPNQRQAGFHGRHLLLPAV